MYHARDALTIMARMSLDDLLAFCYDPTLITETFGQPATLQDQDMVYLWLEKVCNVSHIL